MSRLLASKQTNLRETMSGKAGATRGYLSQRARSVAKRRDSSRRALPARPHAPRKARLAWRGMRIAWGVLASEAKIVGRGAWLGGRISAAAAARRRAQQSHSRLAKLRWAMIGAAAMYLLNPRRRRRNASLSSTGGGEGSQRGSVDDLPVQGGSGAGESSGQENGVASPPLRAS